MSSKGSRYYPLFEHLQHSGEDEVVLAFAQIEMLIGKALPASAKAAKAWWSNRDSGVQARAWREAGYRVTSVDLTTQQVTLRKQRASYHIQQSGGEISWSSESIRALRTYMNLNQTAFADVLGVRQQTISEWEKGVYVPTRASAKHLTRVAEEAGFFSHSIEESNSSS